MSKVAVITARGGSKRIPRKNVKLFHGRPLIEYSIEAALRSELFDEVMVSTDDREIADIAVKCGAKVPFLRSTSNSDDFSTTVDVLLEVFKEYEKEGKLYDYYCCIYPTAPFLTPEKLQNSFQKFQVEKADFLIPVVPFSYPVQRAFEITENGNLNFLSPEFRRTRSQDLPKRYHDVGQFYWGKVDCLKKERTQQVGKVIPFILDEVECQDIDTPEDWVLAELKFTYLQNNK